MNINAKVICDSISPQRVRLTTLELCYHRFIHSEFMTHRMFSRNASSSRAIPIQKMIDQVKNSPAMPIHWGKNQPGMQAGEEIEDGSIWWKSSAQSALQEAKYLMQRGYHKQIVNRILEPFQWIKVIVTATEWDNFFVLRLPYEELNDKQRAIADSWKERFKNNPDGKDAQPEIQELARCMKKAMEESIPVELKPGEWHLPYVERRTFLLEDSEITEDLPIGNVTTNQKAILTTEMAIKCSVARCARVSYNNHDNSSPNIEKDIALADNLLEAGHMSPFEHIATPMETVDSEYHYENFGYAPSASNYWERGITHLDVNHQYWSGNLRGWIQYRNVL